NAAVRRGDISTILEDTDYVLLILEGEPVSFNIRDVTENVDRQLPFVDRSLESARRSLRAEIIKRYAEHDRTDNNIVRRLLAEAGIDVPDEEVIKKSKVTNKTKKNSKKEKSKLDNTKPYILCIGDIFTDAFITLDESSTKIFKEGDDEWLAVPFGRKPPYERVDI